MTVIIAAKFGKRVLIGADTRVSFGSGTMINTVESKLVKCKGFIAGAAGSGPVTEALLEFQDKDFNLKLKSEALRFAREYFKTYCKMEGADDKSAYVLTASKGKIWYIHTKAEVYEISTFHAVGSGAEFARGAMYKDYPAVQSIQDLKDLVEWGMTVACEFDSNCGRPLDLEEI